MMRYLSPNSVSILCEERCCFARISLDAARSVGDAGGCVESNGVLNVQVRITVATGCDKSRRVEGFNGLMKTRRLVIPKAQATGFQKSPNTLHWQRFIGSRATSCSVPDRPKDEKADSAELPFA